MATVSLLNRSLFTLGIFHGLLAVQTTNWRKTLRPIFQFLLLGIVTSQVYFISELFKQLPPNAWNTILENLFEPVVFYCFLISCLFGALALAYTVMAGKIMKSLIG
jgi:hypothetical protein